MRYAIVSYTKHYSAVGTAKKHVLLKPLIMLPRVPTSSQEAPAERARRTAAEAAVEADVSVAVGGGFGCAEIAG